MPPQPAQPTRPPWSTHAPHPKLPTPAPPAHPRHLRRDSVCLHGMGPDGLAKQCACCAPKERHRSNRQEEGLGQSQTPAQLVGRKHLRARPAPVSGMQGATQCGGVPGVHEALTPLVRAAQHKPPINRWVAHISKLKAITPLQAGQDAQILTHTLNRIEFQRIRL